MPGPRRPLSTCLRPCTTGARPTAPAQQTWAERTEKGKGSRGAAGRSGRVARGSRALRHRGTGPRDCLPVTLVFSLWERALTCLNPQTVQDTGCFIHASAKPKTDSTEVPRTSPLKRRRACTLSSLCAARSVPRPRPPPHDTTAATSGPRGCTGLGLDTPPGQKRAGHPRALGAVGVGRHIPERCIPEIP